MLGRSQTCLPCPHGKESRSLTIWTRRPRSAGLNPPISLREGEREREESGGERTHCDRRQCGKKRNVQYQIEVAARQWLPFTGSFTHGLHTALSNASFFSSSPLFCSFSFVLSRLSFFSSSQRNGGIMKPQHAQAVLVGGGGEEELLSAL